MPHRGNASILVTFLLFTLVGVGQAAGQPRVCGNQAALGTWTLASCPTLKDDGNSPDEAAGDGIYTAAVQLTATDLLEYKILPTGMWDGATELKQVGTCPADGSSKTNDTQNIQVLSPDVRKPTLFFYDSRTLPDPPFSPTPNNRSGGDSAMLDAPVGSCPTWLAVGDFQNLYGPNSSAVKLAELRPGVLVGRFTAAKALAAGWRWKVMQQTAGTVRESGPTGWAYAPCTAAFATVSTAAAVGDSVYLLFYAWSGRFQAVVSATLLDGFAPGGTPVCEPPPDMAVPVTDLSPMSPDLATAPAPDLQSPPSADAGSDGGAAPKRPGIHCDCQLGRASDGAPSRDGLLAWLCALGGCFVWIRRRVRSRRFTSPPAEV